MKRCYVLVKVVISLGGSVYYPKRFNRKYLQKLFQLLASYEAQFYIVCGGGALARERIASCKGSTKEKDLAGVIAINDNCLRVADVFFESFSNVKIVDSYEDVSGRANFIIGAKKPGHSSDWNAVRVAEKVKADFVLNLSDIDYIYNKNPSIYKTAKKILELSWLEYFKIIGTRILPGGHYPFDPVASKLARKLKLNVYFINGKKLKRIDNFLEGDLVGSVIWG